jgi:hypothetical protein
MAHSWKNQGILCRSQVGDEGRFSWLGCFADRSLFRSCEVGLLLKSHSTNRRFFSFQHRRILDGSSSKKYEKRHFLHYCSLFRKSALK